MIKSTLLSSLFSNFERISVSKIKIGKTFSEDSKALKSPWLSANRKSLRNQKIVTLCFIINQLQQDAWTFVTQIGIQSLMESI